MGVQAGGEAMQCAMEMTASVYRSVILLVSHWHRGEKMRNYRMSGGAAMHFAHPQVSWKLDYLDSLPAYELALPL